MTNLGTLSPFWEN